MAVLEREELTGKSLDATYKKMTGGEQRFRMRPKGESSLIRSTHITLATEFRWQGGHVHHSGNEHYQLVKGSIGFVSRLPNGVINGGILWYCHKHFEFDPEVTHDIYTSPGAEFITWQVQDGPMTPIEKHGGEDWWPADALFNREIAKRRSEVEKMVKEHSKDE